MFTFFFLLYVTCHHSTSQIYSNHVEYMGKIHGIRINLHLNDFTVRYVINV